MPARRPASIPTGFPPSLGAESIDGSDSGETTWLRLLHRFTFGRRQPWRGIAWCGSTSCAPPTSCSWSGWARRSCLCFSVTSSMARGVIPSLLGAVWLLAFVGLRYPLQMLPLLLFEFVWKTIWLIAFGLPQWSVGTAAGDVRRRLPGHRRRRDPDADRDPLGLRLSPLRSAGCGSLKRISARS